MDKQFNFQELHAIVSTLRSENGCPWDRAQTHETIKGNTIEEAYEVNQAVTDLSETGDPANLCEELGDLLLQVMLHSQIAEENGVQVRTVEYIVRNFASELPEIPTMRKKKKDASEEDYDKLRAEVTRLRKELRQEKMRAEALDTMIDVAEEMFNIPVRKKAGTKQ